MNDELLPLAAAAVELRVPEDELLAKVKAGDVPGVYAPDAGGWFVRRSELPTRAGQ
ncbi:MAG: hypothetical protein ACYCO3_08355 [Mycobacteriales bacterium]